MKTKLISLILISVFSVIILSCGGYDLRNPPTLERTQNSDEINQWLSEVEIYLKVVSDYMEWIDQSTAIMIKYADINLENPVIDLDDDNPAADLLEIEEIWKSRFEDLRYRFVVNRNESMIASQCFFEEYTEPSAIPDIQFTITSGFTVMDQASMRTFEQEVSTIIARMKTIMMMECLTDRGIELLETGSNYAINLSVDDHFGYGYIIKTADDCLVDTLDYLITIRAVAAHIHDFYHFLASELIEN